jgi:hypothetical protein
VLPSAGAGAAIQRIYGLNGTRNALSCAAAVEGLAGGPKRRTIRRSKELETAVTDNQESMKLRRHPKREFLLGTATN